MCGEQARKHVSPSILNRREKEAKVKWHGDERDATASRTLGCWRVCCDVCATVKRKCGRDRRRSLLTLFRWREAIVCWLLFSSLLRRDQIAVLQLDHHHHDDNEFKLVATQFSLPLVVSALSEKLQVRQSRYSKWISGGMFIQNSRSRPQWSSGREKNVAKTEHEKKSELIKLQISESRHFLHRAQQCVCRRTSRHKKNSANFRVCCTIFTTAAAPDCAKGQLYRRAAVSPSIKKLFRFQPFLFTFFWPPAVKHVKIRENPSTRWNRQESVYVSDHKISYFCNINLIFLLTCSADFVISRHSFRTCQKEKLNELVHLI